MDPPPPKRIKDCPTCRLVGTATFATVGGYALWQSRAVAPGTPLQKRMMAGVGIALLGAGVVRWFN
ncbi:hypothetical protein VKT23_001064 [Stygiomarasmius scandens]|uniref:Distal membrane-arm assembly complex protein 1-like domain-containing protein n=1 Tax=Marasmiellus scandens TaxID=2682957 RepID=A0ABR1K8E3_9AGAR